MIATPISRTLADPALYASGAPYEPIAANFPAIKYWFKCNEAANATSMVDAILGATVACSAITKSSDGFAIDPGTVSAVTPTVATLPNPGTKAIVFFGVMKSGGSQGFSQGTAGSGSRARVYGATSTCGIAAGGSSLLSGGTLTISTTLGMLGLIVGPNGTGDVRGFQCVHSSLAVTINAGSANTLTPPISDLPNTLSITATATDIYGLCMWHFTTLPSDTVLADGFRWMTKNWVAGNKWLYPGWAGLS